MENFPNLVKDIDNRHTSPESKQSLKQDEHKKAHTKTYHK